MLPRFPMPDLSHDARSAAPVHQVVDVLQEDYLFWSVLYDVMPAEIAYSVRMVGARPATVERYLRSVSRYCALH